MLMVAAVCAACTQPEERVAIEAGAFTIVREQHTYSNWNTGGSTTYYSFVVRYRKREFQFPGLTPSRSGGHVTDFTSSRIASAYVVSQLPAALLVLAGDPNNDDASWNLLVDTPSGIRAEHVAFHTEGREIEWLDGDAPVPIGPAYELLSLEGGRLLWVDNQSLIDLDSLRVQRLSAFGGSEDGAAFVAFSPDRKKMARFDFYSDPNNFRVTHSLILENDIATGEFRGFNIDKRTMWYDDSRHIDRSWLESYFEWRNEKNAGFTLQPLANPKPRPYHGHLTVVAGTNAVQYHVPRLRFEHRQAAMDFVAGVLGATYTIDSHKPYAQEPTADAAANDDAAPRTDAVSPAFIDPLAWANLDVKGKRLTVYFTDRGLAIENKDPALNEVIRKIAATLDAEFTSPTGRMWIADEDLDP
jgi:hypothetical protein